MDGKNMNEKERLAAKSFMVIAPLAGYISLLLFLIFLFMGSLRLINMGLAERTVLAWDGMLSMLFFIQHSGMIRRGFRTWVSGIIPFYLNDAIFSLFSSFVLAAAVIFWQPSTTILYELQGYSRWIARGVFVLALAGFYWGVYSLKSFDTFGRTSIKVHLKNKPLRTPRFVVQGPYLWIRHPLYFFILILMWSCPDLTLDRLLFNLLWTLWIYIGSVLEEKDLVSDFGEKYRAYQRAVPMLFPWKGPGKRQNFKG